MDAYAKDLLYLITLLIVAVVVIEVMSCGS